MKKNIIFITICVLFALLIISLFLITRNREIAAFKKIQSLNAGQLLNVMFYKDPLRDTEGLDLPLTDKKMVSSFLDCMKKMTPTSIKIKGYTVKSRTTIHFNIDTDKNKLYAAEIYHIEEFGNQAFVSLSIEGIVNFPAGDYLSDDFLPWLEKTAKIEGYEDIYEIDRYSNN